MSNRTCCIEGCAKLAHSRGMCTMHYQRLYHSGSLEKITFKKECKGCGSEFSSAHSNKKFCADKCRNAYHYRSRINKGDLTCRICGGNMTKHSSSAPQGEAAHKECRTKDRPGLTDCPICGIAFMPKPSRNTWTRSCSKPCAMRLAIREGKHNLQDGKQVGRDPEKLRISYEKSTRRRRAKIAGVPSEPYTREEIAERDNWTCWLCFEPIDKTLEWPHRLSASVDHMKPLARGGSDLKSNVRISHLTCNVSKGDKTIEEYREWKAGESDGREKTITSSKGSQGLRDGSTAVLF